MHLAGGREDALDSGGRGGRCEVLVLASHAEGAKTSVNNVLTLIDNWQLSGRRTPGDCPDKYLVGFWNDQIVPQIRDI